MLTGLFVSITNYSLLNIAALLIFEEMYFEIFVDNNDKFYILDGIEF